MHVDTNSLKLRVDWKFLGMGVVKYGQSGHVTLKFSTWLYLKNEQMDWTDFLHVHARSEKLIATSVIFGMAWSFSSWNPKIYWILRMSLWNLLIFVCRLWCNNIWLDWHHTLYLCLFNVFVESLAVALSCLFGHFLRIRSLSFF